MAGLCANVARSQHALTVMCKVEQSCCVASSTFMWRRKHYSDFLVCHRSSQKHLREELRMNLSCCHVFDFEFVLTCYLYSHTRGIYSTMFIVYMVVYLQQCGLIQRALNQPALEAFFVLLMYKLDHMQLQKDFHLCS